MWENLLSAYFKEFEEMLKVHLALPRLVDLARVEILSRAHDALVHHGGLTHLRSEHLGSVHVELVVLGVILRQVGL